MASKAVCVFVIVSTYLSLEITCQDINRQLVNSLLARHQLSNENGIEDDSDDVYNHRPLKNKRVIVQYDGGSSGSSSGGGDPVQTDPWPGRWLPEKVEDAKKVSGSVSRGHLDQMVKMVDAKCDDGKTNLTLDWSGSPENHTCFLSTFVPDPNTRALIMHDYIPTEYVARHECMDKSIEYNSFLPTFGTHRPAWPRYGEYQFVPRQRWIHNLEHGAIVMLYHPCAHPLLVRRLREIVTGCLFRHVITPYTLLSHERPLALVAWGWAMTMANVDEKNVQDFIMSHALRGPEKISQDGQYDYLLEHPAELVTSEDDSKLCPQRIVTM